MTRTGYIYFTQILSDENKFYVTTGDFHDLEYKKKFHYVNRFRFG